MFFSFPLELFNKRTLLRMKSFCVKHLHLWPVVLVCNALFVLTTATLHVLVLFLLTALSTTAMMRHVVKSSFAMSTVVE